MKNWAGGTGVILLALRRMVRRRSSGRKKRTAYAGYARSGAGGANGRAQPARHTGLWVIAILAALVVVNLYVFVWDKRTSVGAIKHAAEVSPTMTVGAAPLTSGAGAIGPANSATHAEPELAHHRVSEGKVAKADTLGRLLKREGVAPGASDELIRAVSGVLDWKSLRAGQAFVIDRTDDGRIARFELALGDGKRVRALRNGAHELVATLADR